MTTMTAKTLSGLTVKAIAGSNSHGCGGQVFIDDVYFTDFDSVEHDEAEAAAGEAMSHADMFDAGMIRRTETGWELAVNAQLPAPKGYAAEWN